MVGVIAITNKRVVQRIVAMDKEGGKDEGRTYNKRC